MRAFLIAKHVKMNYVVAVAAAVVVVVSVVVFAVFLTLQGKPFSIENKT